MIINMAKGATEAEIQNVIDNVVLCGYQPHVIRGTERTIVAAVGSGGNRTLLEALKVAPGVEDAIPIAHPFKLVSKQVHRDPSIIEVGDVKIGGDEIVVIAGPCSVESREQLLDTAVAVKNAGARMLRGGACKPRTSPYDFQGLAIEALKMLCEAGELIGLHVVSEVMSGEEVDSKHDHADVLQVGARNMQNFALLRRLARVDRSILLKRGPSATVK